MGTQIFLGMPPAHIKKWIEDHAQPAGHPETRVKYVGGATATFDIEEVLGQASIDNRQNVEEVDIGNTVTTIIDGAFEFCPNLTTVTIPSSTTCIGSNAFYDCINLTSVTFLGKTMEQVRNIEDIDGYKQYPWGISDTSIIHVA